MQLSCLPVSFFADILEGRMTIAEWARYGASIGLDAIDLSALFFAKATPAAIRREVEDAGMSVTMVTSYPDFTHPDAAQRAKELQAEREVVEAATALGARYVRVTAGQAHPATPRAEGIAWAVEGLHKLVETAGNLGPRLVYENHGKPGIWQYTDFSQPQDIFLEIVRGTADTGLGINFDTANATAFTPDPVALLDQVIGRVVTIHAADTAVKGALQGVVIGQGIVPFREIFGRLHRAGWDGWICIEEAARQGLPAVEAAARFVRRAWQESRP